MFFDIEAADRRLARLRTVAPLVTEPVEVVGLQRVDPVAGCSPGRCDSSRRPVSDTASEWSRRVNLLRSTVDKLQRERELLRAEVARQRAVVDQSAVMEHFDRPRRIVGARKCHSLFREGTQRQVWIARSPCWRGTPPGSCVTEFAKVDPNRRDVPRLRKSGSTLGRTVEDSSSP